MSHKDLVHKPPGRTPHIKEGHSKSASGNSCTSRCQPHRLSCPRRQGVSISAPLQKCGPVSHASDVAGNESSKSVASRALAPVTECTTTSLSGSIFWRQSNSMAAAGSLKDRLMPSADHAVWSLGIKPNAAHALDASQSTNAASPLSAAPRRPFLPDRTIRSTDDNGATCAMAATPCDMLQVKTASECSDTSRAHLNDRRK